MKCSDYMIPSIRKGVNLCFTILQSKNHIHVLHTSRVRVTFEINVGKTFTKLDIILAWNSFQAPFNISIQIPINSSLWS